jgi:hypothetical protein
MGFIDSNDFTVTCPQCAATEEARVVQRGSSFGATWGDPKPLVKFDADWKDAGVGGPFIVRAKCRTCGVETDVH